MGTCYIHQCNNCAYIVRTSGPWGFYRDSDGSRKLYGHPEPMSEEAKERGIYGLSAKVYCPDCDKVHDLIIVEFKNPSDNSLDVWLGNYEPDDMENEVNCPDCGNTRLVFVPDEDVEVKCPQCGEGYLMGRQE
ncbi:MAG: hypothetical protein ACLFUI_02585 [Halanaerobiales bacterium]